MVNKQNVTLSVDREPYEILKARGVNVSEIANSAFRAAAKVRTQPSVDVQSLQAELDAKIDAEQRRIAKTEFLERAVPMFQYYIKKMREFESKPGQEWGGRQEWLEDAVMRLGITVDNFLKYLEEYKQEVGIDGKE